MAHAYARSMVVATADGSCPVRLHVPDIARPLPVVLIFMDAPGMRPALDEIAARLAAAGYVVALPDLFYRAGPYAPIDPKVVFGDPALRADHRAKVMAGATPDAIMRDTGFLLDALDALPETDGGAVGVVGYCMGGKLALIAAASFPDRIAVAASYHAGGLATDEPESPHLLVRSIRARVYVAGATDDANFPEAMKDRLEAALTEADVDHRIETYPARHGWVPRDTAAHDPAEAEHHWSTLVPLMDDVLKANRR